MSHVTLPHGDSWNIASKEKANFFFKVSIRSLLSYYYLASRLPSYITMSSSVVSSQQ